VSSEKAQWGFGGWVGGWVGGLQVGREMAARARNRATREAIGKGRHEEGGVKKRLCERHRFNLRCRAPAPGRHWWTVEAGGSLAPCPRHHTHTNPARKAILTEAAVHVISREEEHQEAQPGCCHDWEDSTQHPTRGEAIHQNNAVEA
jgi:hypothetical protein